jgi:hypothetical protein
MFLMIGKNAADAWVILLGVQDDLLGCGWILDYTVVTKVVLEATI